MVRSALYQAKRSNKKSKKDICLWFYMILGFKSQSDLFRSFQPSRVSNKSIRNNESSAAETLLAVQFWQPSVLPLKHT